MGVCNFVFCCLGFETGGLDLEDLDLETREPAVGVDLLLLGREVPLVDTMAGTLDRTVLVGAMAGYSLKELCLLKQLVDM